MNAGYCRGKGVKKVGVCRNSAIRLCPYMCITTYDWKNTYEIEFF